MNTDKSIICCGKKPIRADKYLTSINMGAALLHYLLAVGIVTTLSFWKVHEHYENDVLMGKIFNFLAMAIAIVLTIILIWALLSKKPGKNERDKCKKCNYSNYVWARTSRGTVVILILWSTIVIFSALGLVYSVPWISGTFPVYITLSPNTASPTYPYNTTICDGKDYKNEPVFDWVQCIRDEENIRTRKIFDVKTGELKDWVNNANKGCADAAVVCSDTVENGYSSNQACQKCGGGQKCKGRTCYISDNPNSFIQVSGLESDPSSFIQVGVPQVIVPYKELINVNVGKIKTLNAANNKWELTDLENLVSILNPVSGILEPTVVPNIDIGTSVKFYHDGQKEGPYDSGTWQGNGQVEHQRAWYNWWFLYGFCILTSGMHTLLAVSGWFESVEKTPEEQKLLGNNEESPKKNCCEWGYLHELENGKQPYRWLEYSITASIMFFIVLQLNRVTDLWTNLTAFLLTVNYNVFGAAIDLTNNAVFIGWFWIVSFLSFTTLFICLFYNTEKTIEPYLDADLETSDLWSQLFGFVRVVNFAILSTFLTFPILNAIHLYYKLNNKPWDKSEEDKDKEIIARNCMYRAEIGYVILSFVSKGLLVFLVFWGVAARND